MNMKDFMPTKPKLNAENVQRLSPLDVSALIRETEEQIRRLQKSSQLGTAAIYLISQHPRWAWHVTNED